MELLKERIRMEGMVLNNSVLKVDSFLNHQLDPELIMEIGAEFARRFAGVDANRIITIESSGIPVALTAGLKLGLPVVFARKKKSILMTEDVWHTQVYSYTKQETNDITILKKFLLPGDKVLIIDDFLASGEAALGLANLVEGSGSHVAGIGIVIEKSFQPGRTRLEERGYRVESLVRIAAFADGQVKFI